MTKLRKLLFGLALIAETATSQELRQSKACDDVDGRHGGVASAVWSPPSLSEMNLEMQTPHPVRPLGGGVGWNVRPTPIMGTEPYGTAVPKSWTGVFHEEWRAVTPWFVVYPSETAFSAPNSAVQIDGIQLWYLSTAKGNWIRIASGGKPSWQGNYSQEGKWVKATAIPPTLRDCAGVFAPETGHHAHGGLTKFETPWDTVSGKADIAALLVIVRHRLIRLNAEKPDDRISAKYLVMAGADYYPTVHTKLADLRSAYVPGVGLGQFKQSTLNWNYSTMIVWNRSIDQQGAARKTNPNTFTAP